MDYSKIIALMSTSLGAVASIPRTRIYGAENIKRHLQQKKSFHARDAHTSIASINRHTGRPHEHKREAQRRLRQMARSS